MPGGSCAPLRGGRIVEHATHRGGQPRYVAGCTRHPGLSIDDRFTQTADVGRHQRGAGRGGLQCHQPKRFVVAGQHRGVGSVQQRQQLGVVEVSDEPGCSEHPVFAGLIDQPILLGAFAGDGQCGAWVSAPEPRQRGDGVVHALLVLQPPHIEQFGWPGARAAGRERPARRVNAVTDHGDLGQPGPEQLGDLVVHRRRACDQRIGFTHQPRLDRVHLTAESSGDPAGMSTGLRCMNRGNHWHVIELGKGDGRMGHQPVVCVHDVRTPRAVGAKFLQAQPGADHGVAHRQGPGHHVVAKRELVRVLRGRNHPDPFGHLIGGWVCAGIGARRTPGQHDDIVTGCG
ncbi:Uncharacterised protein [Mycobacterium tuberculosis]|uniref:Uncharacterized protein n=1 Tax=Mycobacterium tuberculosis TaxID=1773 RepID=A0A655ADF2_MYCTX|nr:Uncharacterised protein [Mycobacterium tuberculosis]CKT27909.1 Uncharacterised protein [Mycobacterium tuberculosis]CNL96926.1 Uncharacterised protein [Mycobacterium tuberculosis]CNM32585.1 Uncharacterised protein [Mycobacterium tuberculosis]CNN17102.1 Uncharacterised protein [Mycobacterium tuberculosis]